MSKPKFWTPEADQPYVIRFLTNCVNCGASIATDVAIKIVDPITGNEDVACSEACGDLVRVSQAANSPKLTESRARKIGLHRHRFRTKQK